MIKILLSDDNTLLFEDFKDRAHRLGIHLDCVTNWEDAQIKLEDNWDDYAGLILDGKGKLDEGSSGNDAKHLSRSLGWLNQKYATGFLMPTVIYSAFIGNAAGNLEDNIDTNQPFIIEVYSKDKDVEVVLKRIQNYSIKLPENRLKHQYQDIFALFDDKRMPKSMRQTMVDVLKNLSKSSADKTDYNKIRDLIEEMLKMANSIDKAFIPDILLNPSQNGRPNLGFSVFYLAGRDVINGVSILLPKISPIMKNHIARIYSSIVNCSQIFSHTTSHNHYHYSYKSTVFGLLEVLLWYRDYLTTKYKI